MRGFWLILFSPENFFFRPEIKLHAKLLSPFKDSFSMAFIVIAGVCIVSSFIHASDLDTRVINRKNVSHIVINTSRKEIFITLLISDRFPYNYKSHSYPFYFQVKSSREAIELSEKLDKYLDTGKNLKIYLNGSRIKKIRYLK